MRRMFAPHHSSWLEQTCNMTPEVRFFQPLLSIIWRCCPSSRCQGFSDELVALFFGLRHRQLPSPKTQKLCQESPWHQLKVYFGSAVTAEHWEEAWNLNWRTTGLLLSSDCWPPLLLFQLKLPLDYPTLIELPWRFFLRHFDSCNNNIYFMTCTTAQQRRVRPEFKRTCWDNQGTIKETACFSALTFDKFFFASQKSFNVPLSTIFYSKNTSILTKSGRNML